MYWTDGNLSMGRDKSNAKRKDSFAKLPDHDLEGVATEVAIQPARSISRQDTE